MTIIAYEKKIFTETGPIKKNQENKSFEMQKILMITFKSDAHKKK